MVQTDATLACDILAALQRAKDQAGTQLDHEVLDELHQAVKAAMVEVGDVQPLSSIVLTITAKHEDD